LVQFQTTVRDRFEASHHVEGHSTCGGNHGHEWEVLVTVSGGLDPKKVYVVDHGALAHDLFVVVDEFRNRDLNDMLPGVITTPEGLGLYIRERLILDWPRIVMVEVRMSRWAATTITGDIR
jgi:6-pyruvoyl-tetrahydropterin synthase